MNISTILSFTPETDEFAGKTILVTGAAQGIGRKLSIELTTYGATVILSDKSISGLEEVYDHIENLNQQQAAIYPLDLEKVTPNDLSTLVKIVSEEMGHLDGLVNNAGWIGGFKPFDQVTTEFYQKVLTSNLHSQVFLTQYCLPLLKQSNFPKILFSTHQLNEAYAVPFGIAKAGISAFMEILSKEFSSVCCNAIDTGPINTGMRRVNYPGSTWDHLPSVDDVVNAYLFFLSSKNTLSGENISLYDGLTS